MCPKFAENETQQFMTEGIGAHDVLLGPPAEEEPDEKSADIGIYN